MNICIIIRELCLTTSGGDVLWKRFTSVGSSQVKKLLDALLDLKNFSLNYLKHVFS